MKKFLFLFALIASVVSFASCSSDDEVADTTYTLHWDTMGSGSLINIDVILFEYSESGDKIGSHSIDKVKDGDVKSFTAGPKTAKVKVYYEMNDKPKWVQTVFYLVKEKNTDITVDDHTIVGNKEP